eukprot:TRINITY_DN3203_c0_g3_i3.p1 TRINITY_DN3203_c0_g3~~TRINITY_DN3203_c0_g3_i3.p1  ORF type:complete len:194 (-),score=56.98 TRINITY_DN3203_c0_g3_i3:798-1379(-)
MMNTFEGSVEKVIEAVLKDNNYKYVTVNKLYNCYQYYKNILILDLRDSNTFFKAHFFCSVNIPDSTISPEELVNYDPKVFTEQHFVKPEEKSLFTRRKRLMVFIIPGNSSMRHFADDLSVLAKELRASPVEDKDRMLKAKRFALSCMLYQALKGEKVRELYILKEGFRKLLRRVPFLCLFQGAKIYPEPYFPH